MPSEASSGIGATIIALVALIAGASVAAIYSYAERNQSSSEYVAGESLSLEFDKEVNRIAKEFRCRSSGTSPADSVSGRLYGCIFGFAETVKIFINEDEASYNKVKNIKAMWNAWHIDRGYGVWADRDDAYLMVRTLLRFYAPQIEDEAIVVFRGRSSRQFFFKSLHVEYRWTPGPGINEHLLTFTPL